MYFFSCPSGWERFGWTLGKVMLISRSFWWHIMEVRNDNISTALAFQGGGRPALESRKAALCVGKVGHSGWGEVSTPRLSIRMSLSDFPSLVTFRDAAFRLISRWMLLVTTAESVSYRKAVSQIRRHRLHKGFSCGASAERNSVIISYLSHGEKIHNHSVFN